MMFPVRLAMFVAVLAFSQSLPAELAGSRSTVCKGRLGYEYDGDVLPGTELLPGVFTGMTWKEAKNVAPTMVGREATVELFPGKRMLARIHFESYHKHGVFEVGFTGRPADSPAEELTQRFGKPLKLDFGVTGLSQFNHWAPSPPERFEVLKWCDGPRIYIMRSDEGGFDLTISGPRTRN